VGPIVAKGEIPRLAGVRVAFAALMTAVCIVLMLMVWSALKLVRYDKPFDRHDWTISRCGEPRRYIIDYYGAHTFARQIEQELNEFDVIHVGLNCLFCGTA
jgi:hypothetical protein